MTKYSPSDFHASSSPKPELCELRRGFFMDRRRNGIKTHKSRKKALLGRCHQHTGVRMLKALLSAMKKIADDIHCWPVKSDDTEP